MITGYRFKTYLDGLGKTRLLQIKYKYFSDKALYLWQLCYDFFDNANRMNIQQERKEYLLVKSFNIVFEAIIDELLGEKNIPAGLKEQADGKRIDHLYTYQNLITSKIRSLFITSATANITSWAMPSERNLYISSLRTPETSSSGT